MTSDPIRRLKTYGHDLGTIALSRLPKTMDRVCFLCVNSYTSYRLSLGTGPINDAVTMAKCVKNYGYSVYYLHNPHSKTFLKYLDAFLARTTVELIFYYVGHGTSVKDLNGDEADGYDEAFVFEDGNIIDDDLLIHLQEHKHPDNELVLITDACHSGTIWDIDQQNDNLPKRIITISAAADAQTAKQTTIDRMEQGIFTYNFSKQVKANPKITPSEMQVQMRKVLRTYGQTFTVCTTSPEMLNEPLFQ